MRAIALVSGGLDSVVAAWAARSQYELAAVLTFDYGQRARERELEASKAFAGRVPCGFIVVELPWLAALGGSALTDAARSLPELSPDQLDTHPHADASARAVWVPNRNGVFVNIAAAYAEVLDCDAIVCGFNAEEAATFPDNSPAFIDAANAFLGLSTQRRPRVVSPTAHLTKVEIVRLGRQIAAPLELVWSCYLGGAEPCGRCESCLRLRRALDLA